MKYNSYLRRSDFANLIYRTYVTLHYAPFNLIFYKINILTANYKVCKKKGG